MMIGVGKVVMAHLESASIVAHIKVGALEGRAIGEVQQPQAHVRPIESLSALDHDPQSLASALRHADDRTVNAVSRVPIACCTSTL
jgi:hypothetical protein